MTPKMFWSWLGSLIFVVTVLWNLMYGIPEPILVILIGLWSLCFAATIKVDNPIRKKHWKSLEDVPAKGQVYATKRRPEIKPAPKPKFQWPDGFSDWKEADRDWYVRQMELSGWVFDEGDKVPVKNDIGPSFPWPDVQEARANIDRAGRQKNCRHCTLDQIEITSLSDDQQVMLCKKCGKQLGGVIRAEPKED